MSGINGGKMKIEIELDKKFVDAPWFAAYKCVGYILGKFGLTKNATKEMFDNILHDIDEHQVLTSDFSFNRYFDF
jgi:hypothetical protein